MLSQHPHGACWSRTSGSKNSMIRHFSCSLVSSARPLKLFRVTTVGYIFPSHTPVVPPVTTVRQYITGEEEARLHSEQKGFSAAAALINRLDVM